MAPEVAGQGRRHLLAITMILSACGGVAHSEPPPPPPAAALAAVESRLDRLESALTDSQRRLAALEQRAGLRPYRPAALQPWPGGDPVSLPKRMQRLDARGARPQPGRPSPSGPYVLAFWATWCKPCTAPEELDRLRWLARELRAEGLSLVNVAIDGLSKIQQDPRAATWIYPVWQADDAHIDALPRAFLEAAGMGLPLFAVVDGQGRLRYTRAQALDDAAVAELVAATRSLD